MREAIAGEGGVQWGATILQSAARDPGQGPLRGAHSQGPSLCPSYQDALHQHTARGAPQV